MQLPVPDGLKKAPKNIDKNLFDLLWKLTNNKSQRRIDACKDIFHLLQRKQDEAENSNEPTKDLQYCLERLVKGLASSRDSARLGFSVLLTEILKHMDVEIEYILELVKQHLSDSSGLEKKDVSFGQFFACVSIVRSGKLANHSHLSFVITMLHDLWHEKSYIQKACYEILTDLLSQLSEETFVQEVWPHLKEKLSFGWQKCSADLVWPLFLSIRLFPNAVTAKFLKKNWGTADMLSSENFDHIKRNLRQTTSCLPVLHPLCSEILNLCVLRKDGKELWKTLIDDNLFDAEQTEKAFVGFEMVKKVLQSNHKKKIIKYILSPKFCALFTKSLLNVKHPMNPAATSLGAFLLNFVKEAKDPDIQIIILNIFLNSSASPDKIFKRKEVIAIIQNLLPDAVKVYFERLKSISVMKSESNDEEERDILHKRSHTVLQMGSLVSHPAVVSDIDWRVDVVKFLFLHSFFKLHTPTDSILHCDMSCIDIGANLREKFTNSFFKALNSLSHRAEQNSTHIELFLQHLLSLIEYAEQLMEATEFVTPCFDLDKVQESWQQLKSSVNKLTKQNKKDGKTNESNIFQALFLELAFHLLQDPEHIIGVLEELHICCKKALHDRKHSEEGNEDEPSWVCVVVDILLSLLSRNLHNLRCVVTTVFPLLCPFITTEALQLILDVISPDQTEETMMIDEEAESDVAFDSESSEDESDSEQDDIKADDKFRAEVKEALGPAAEGSDDESVILSDTEMFKRDEALGKAFKTRIESSRTKQDEEKTVNNFRARCLDLITLYLKSDPPMHLVLQCIQPILSAYEFGRKGKHHEHFSHKAVSTLLLLEKIKKFQNLDHVEKSELKEQLELLVSKCQKETDLTVAIKLYSLCVFLVLCFRRIAPPSPEKKSKKIPIYMKIYLSELETFARGGKTNIFPQFFVSLMKACPDLAVNFIKPLKDYAFNAFIRVYRRTQCLGILLEALKFVKGQSSVTAEQWLEIEGYIIPSAIKTLKLTLDNPEFKPVYAIELLNIIYSLMCILKEKTNQSLLDKTDLLPYLMGMESKRVKKLTNKGKNVRRKLITALGGKIPTNEKPKPGPVSLDTESTNLEDATSNGMDVDLEQAEDEDCSQSNAELNNSNQNDSLNSSKRKLKKKDRKKKKMKMNESADVDSENDVS